MCSIAIRTVSAEDTARLLEIYAYYVQNTAISFEYETPTAEEFRKRIVNTLQKYPYLCILQDGVIMGYAYAGPFHTRAAYQWAAETTIYLDHQARKRGLGRSLYEKLEAVLKEMGIVNLYACIGYPEREDEYLTANSAEFHMHMGYAEIGKFHRCGYKFDRWYDMIYMEKIIGEHNGRQKDMIPFPDLGGVIK